MLKAIFIHTLFNKKNLMQSALLGLGLTLQLEVFCYTPYCDNIQSCHMGAVEYFLL